MTKIAGIYKITNKINGKAYIGRSVDVRRRWQGHLAAASQGRPYPICNAIRKYGVAAFEFEVLLACDGAILRQKELEFIVAHGTWASEKGYNVGGTDSGFPSTPEMALMDDSTREAWMERYRANAQKGRVALAELRKDLVYEATYLAIKSAASTRREAAMRERRATDKAYDNRIGRIKRAASQSSRRKDFQQAVGEAFRERFSSDPAFAARVSANRARAARIGHANRVQRGEASIYYAQLWRLEGAKLKDICELTGKDMSWASIHTRGLKDAAVS